jgi:tryptophan synthase beta chain
MTRGRYAYDFCDTGMVTPLAKMYTLGHDFMPSPIHAGGLRYHGMSPILSQLYEDGLMEARTATQSSVFQAAEVFARTEGIVPAPESTHAIAATIREAKKCKETGEKKVILFNLSGHGLIDMPSYDQFINGDLRNYTVTDEEISNYLKDVPQV